MYNGNLYRKNNEFTSTALLDKKGDVARKYHVMGLPVSFLIDKNGEEIYIVFNMINQ